MDRISGLISDRTAFIVLAIFGFLMCSRGAAHITQTGGWLRWAAFLSGALGLLALLLIFSVLAGRELPLISGDRAALMGLAAIIVTKLGIDLVYRAA